MRISKPKWRAYFKLWMQNTCLQLRVPESGPQVCNMCLKGFTLNCTKMNQLGKVGLHDILINWPLYITSVTHSNMWSCIVYIYIYIDVFRISDFFFFGSLDVQCKLYHKESTLNSRSMIGEHAASWSRKEIPRIGWTSFV